MRLLWPQKRDSLGVHTPVDTHPLGAQQKVRSLGTRAVGPLCVQNTSASISTAATAYLLESLPSALVALPEMLYFRYTSSGKDCAQHDCSLLPLYSTDMALLTLHNVLRVYQGSLPSTGCTWRKCT
jgi:hypothetical protein